MLVYPVQLLLVHKGKATQALDNQKVTQSAKGNSPYDTAKVAHTALKIKSKDDTGDKLYKRPYYKGNEYRGKDSKDYLSDLVCIDIFPNSIYHM